MPDWTAELRARLRRGKRPLARHEEIIMELAQHLEDEYAARRARGEGDAEARAAIEAELAQMRPGDWPRTGGGRPLPPASGGGRLRSIWDDARYGWRMIVRAPAFTAAAVLSLALGIGASTAVFSLLNVVLLERLAIRRPAELVALFADLGTLRNARSAAAADGGDAPIDYTAYRALAAAPSLPPVAAYRTMPVTLSARGVTDDQTWADIVSANFFDLLGVAALRGRTFDATDEATQAPVAVISQDYWERRFGADPNVVGTRVEVNGASLTVIGVMPRSYHGVYFGRAFTIAMPLAAASLVTDANWPSLALTLFTRREHGMPVDQLTSRFDAVLARLPGQPRVRAEDASRGLPWATHVRDHYRITVFALMAAVIVLLLVSCVNVGHLLLARGAARGRELAIRASLGASRWRIARQLLTESAELALLGAALGLVLAWWITALLARNLPSDASSLADLVVLRPTLATALVVAALLTASTVLFGLAPAIRAGRVDVREALGGVVVSRRGRVWSGIRGLVTAQVALALVLLCVAGLFVTMLWKLERFDGGYRTRGIVFADVRVPGLMTFGTPHARLPYDSILNVVRHVPGVDVVGAGTTAPLAGQQRNMLRLRLTGAQVDTAFADAAFVSPRYLAATGIGVVSGRDFDDRDGAADPPVAIISATLARRTFGSRSPIGASLFVNKTTLRIVGVSGDARQPQMGLDRRDDVNGAPTAIVYVPLAQGDRFTGKSGPSLLMLVARLRDDADPAQTAPAIHRALGQAVPRIDIRKVESVEQVLDELLPRERLSAGLASFFGAIALGLAAIGFYGVVTYNVDRRTAEIGIRMALGARPVDAFWLVVRDTLAMTGVGLAVGGVAALWATYAIRGLLYDVSPADPRVLLGAALMLVCVGFVAAAVPGRRASRVDPATALRSDGGR